MDDSIRLLVINYKITNPEALKWFSYSILIYFAWRFYLSPRVPMRIGYSKSINIQSFPNKGSNLYKKLVTIAKENYVKKRQLEFEVSRESIFLEEALEGFNNNNYSLTVTKLYYKSGKLTSCYQVQYEGTKLPGFDFLDGEVIFGRTELFMFKFISFCQFSLQQEDAPDYILPWVLFSLAVFCGLLIEFGVSINCIG